MVDKMREAGLRRFGYLKRQGVDALVRRCERLDIMGTTRGKGRPKKYRQEMIRKDMVQLQVPEDMTFDRRVRRIRIRVEG